MDSTVFVPAGAFAIVFGIFFLFAIAATVVWVWSIVDAVRFTDQQYDAAGQNKIVWVLILVLLGLLGTIIYAVVARPSLKSVRVSYPYR